MNYEEQLEEWFRQYEDDEKQFTPFEKLETKLHPCKQVAAIMFLASKLKDKSETFFLHGEHDTLYIGSGFEVFEEFTEEDVKLCMSYGIYTADDGNGGFQMYASM